uniref:Reverse transcriptase Ty1/copia-type domain-containing protein n=1 Tax=Tanacetum cinerariifolium TaxID=118510 RepID=A0A6L2L0Y6_TANCI|nr:hypothetical protein [Tanacetum cinerariifolium]
MFLIASRFPTPPLACAIFIPRATVKQVIIGLSSLIHPLIDHHGCYECGNSLNDFLGPHCTCEFCGNGAHVGESEGENGCDVLGCFTTFSNILFDAEYEFDYSVDQSLSDEDFLKEIFSNPLFEEEITSTKIDPHHFDAESNLIESMLNRDSSIISSSSKNDYLLDEFAGELTLLKSIPPGIDKTDCYPEEDIRLIERLLYDNSSPRLPEEFVSEYSDADIESFSPSPILDEDSDSRMEEIDLSFNPDDPMPPGIEDDDDDSERDMLILKELLDNYSLSLPVNKSFHFDIPLFSRPPAKPPDGNTGILNIKMMGTKDNNNAGQARKEKEPGKDYILLPLWTVDSPFPQEPKSSQDAGFKPSNDVRKKVNEVPRQENKCKDQEEKDNVNITNRVNAVRSTVNAASNEVNVVGRKSSIKLLDDLNMPDSEHISIFEDSNKDVFGLKWVFKNKLDERGIVIRNKTRLVAQGHIQDEGIDYDEVFAPVARIEAIRLFLAYASFKDFVVNDTLWISSSPKSMYETLSTYLLDNGFQRGKIDKTLFIRRYKGDILLVQVYVDDIIFGSTKKELCTSFEKLMHDKFQMISMGELTFFLGLQVKHKQDGIFLSQDKYVNMYGFFEVKTTSTPIETQKPMLKDEDGEEVDVHIYRSMIGLMMYLTSSRPNIMFVVCACAKYQVNHKVSHFHTVKMIFRYLKGQPKLGLWYPKDSPFDLMAYIDSDYAGASLDRKSTTEGYQFLRYRLISWQCKKQTVVANSKTEAEHKFMLLGKLTTVRFNAVQGRRDLQLADEDGIDCLLNTTIFENLALMGYEKKVFDLEDKLKRTKTAQQTKINGLERRVKKLEKKHMSRTHKLKRLYKVGLTAKVIRSSNDEALNKEDTSKQGRIDEIDADEDIALVSTHDEISIHDDVTTQVNIVQDIGIEDVDEEEVVEVVTTAKILIDTVVDAAQVTTAIADIPVSAAKIIVTTAPTIIAESTKINVEVTQAPKRKRSYDSRAIENNNHKNSFFITTSGLGQRSLKKKFFAEIQELFDEAMKSINNFVDFKTELVEESLKKDAVTEDDGDDVTIDATPLFSKSPIIVDYKIYKEGKKNYFQIFRADGNSQMYLTFNKLLKNFNREDLEVLWQLVKARFKKVQPVDNMDSFLLHNLKTMFSHHVEDNVWKNQH